jgi:signal transduction histidine kinase
VTQRHRLSDWGWAAAVLPFTMLFQNAGLPGLVPSVHDPSPLGSGHWLVEAAYSGGVVVGIPILVSLTVLWRRTRPALLLSTALVVVVLFGNYFPALFAVYSYAAWFPSRRRLLAWTGTYLAIQLAQFRIQAHQMELSPPTLFSFVVSATLFGVPLGFGLWIGTRRELIASLRERASRLEREQRLMAEHAAAEERGRIAREMHDVVAHRVSLMVLHAGGLEVSAPDRHTAEVADTIRTTGREALTELRGVLGVLREDTEEAPTAPQPTLADVDRLLQEWREAGMSVRRVDTGDQRPLPTAPERTAYRILQEGLTNAAKHATGASVTVHLDIAPQALTVTVANGPPPTGEYPPAPGGGHGLIGLAERASRAGGTLTSGVTPDGGWRLRATLPLSD